MGVMMEQSIRKPLWHFQREVFWRGQTKGDFPNDRTEIEWVADGIEPTIDEEVARYQNGKWKLCGYSKMRHWVREIPAPSHDFMKESG